MWNCFPYVRYYHVGFYWPHLLIGLILMILFIALLLVLFRGHSPRKMTNLHYQNLLKEKLASGQITIEEYERKIEIIKK